MDTASVGLFPLYLVIIIICCTLDTLAASGNAIAYSVSKLRTELKLNEFCFANPYRANQVASFVANIVTFILAKQNNDKHIKLQLSTQLKTKIINIIRVLNYKNIIL